MAVQLDYLLRATRAAQSCSDIRIQLRRKGDRPFLEWTMVSVRDELLILSAVARYSDADFD